jgi:hypothetical protein
MHTSLAVVLGCAAACMTGAWLYFRRFTIMRPPIGVVKLTDILVMIAAIILIPYLYLALPTWLVAGLLGLGALSLTYFMSQPVLRLGWLAGLFAAALVGADIATGVCLGVKSTPFLVANDVVIVLMAVGVGNIWAQSGLRARDLAVLAAALVVYDFVATARLPLMDEMIQRLATMPLVPLVAWGAGSEQTFAGLGLGDLTFASVLPLVMRKAFGRTAGRIALGSELCAVAALMLGLHLSGTKQTFPVMVVLGPLTLIQYAFWRLRQGPERTVRQYLAAEPRSGMTAVRTEG